MGKKGSLILQEGKVEFEVPPGDVTKSSEVFYNPVMEFPRDISIAVYRALLDEGTFLDALSASGVRALRVAKEVGLDVTANDLNPSATRLIARNAEKNKLKIRVENRNASALMADEYFDVIDIDPFGTPVPYLDNAYRSARKFLSVTATDTAVLCGTYPSTCWRRYLAKSIRTEFLHELGVRILAGYVVRMAARFDIAAEPIFTHSKYHYYRLYFRMSKGADRCNKLLKDISTIHWDQKTLERKPSKTSNELGPMWLGKLWDKSLVKKVFSETAKGQFNTQTKMLSLLETLGSEADRAPFHFDIHKLCKQLNREVPPFKAIYQSLEKAGIKYSKTHFSPTGLRADCELDKLKKIIKSIPS
jgi:tRNA (guanine26-N2/guanine27-N2)-dimethyltransferase